MGVLSINFDAEALTALAEAQRWLPSQIPQPEATALEHVLLPSFSDREDAFFAAAMRQAEAGATFVPPRSLSKS